MSKGTFSLVSETGRGCASRLDSSGKPGQEGALASQRGATVVLLVVDIFSPGFGPPPLVLDEIIQFVTSNGLEIDWVAGGHGGEGLPKAFASGQVSVCGVRRGQVPQVTGAL